MQGYKRAEAGLGSGFLFSRATNCSIRAVEARSYKPWGRQAGSREEFTLASLCFMGCLHSLDLRFIALTSVSIITQLASVPSLLTQTPANSSMALLSQLYLQEPYFQVSHILRFWVLGILGGSCSAWYRWQAQKQESMMQGENGKEENQGMCFMTLEQGVGIPSPPPGGNYPSSLTMPSE